MAKNNLLLMAKYNIWATEKLLLALQDLDEAQIRADCGLYFGSIFATLNHMLLAEHYLWYPRCAEGKSQAYRLDHIIETDLSRLYQTFAQNAQRWPELIQATPVEQLDGKLNYTSTQGQALSLPYAAILQHVFNHATHHRGQITAAITMLGGVCPELDLVYMLLEDA